MKKLAAIGALGLMTSVVFAQGLNTGGQTKESWEEINFEFNSSVLVDGYPSLLRLAELLKQHPEYRVRLEGNADWIGSDQYNDKLALARAETVKSFLVKYGAGPGQVETTAAKALVAKGDEDTVLYRQVRLAARCEVEDKADAVVVLAQAPPGGTLVAPSSGIALLVNRVPRRIQIEGALAHDPYRTADDHLPVVIDPLRVGVEDARSPDLLPLADHQGVRVSSALRKVGGEGTRRRAGRRVLHDPEIRGE